MTNTVIPAAGDGLPAPAGITRRNLLKTAPVAGAMAAAGGLAVASIAAACERDPVLVAIAEWERAWLATWGPDGLYWDDEESPETNAAIDVEDDACNAVCATVATTAAGLAAQLRFAYEVFGDNKVTAAPGYREREPYSEPDAYEFSGWTNGRGGVLLASLLASARSLAEVRS